MLWGTDRYVGELTGHGSLSRSLSFCRFISLSVSLFPCRFKRTDVLSLCLCLSVSLSLSLSLCLSLSLSGLFKSKGMYDNMLIVYSADK